MTYQEIKWIKERVKEGTHEMDIFIPDSGDRIETQDLRQASIEKTRGELRNKPEREKGKHSKEDVAAFIRDQRERAKRGKKYY